MKRIIHQLLKTCSNLKMFTNFKHMKKISLVLMLMISMVLVSCFSKKETEDKPKTEAIEISSPEVEKALEFYQRFPSAEEVLPALIGDEFVYNESLAINKNQFSFTESRFTKKVLLGYYLADIAYCSVFEEKSEAISFLKSFVLLCDELQLRLTIDQSTLEKLDESVNNDSIENLYSSNYIEIIKSFESNNDKASLDIISGGLLIEMLYLSLYSATNDEVYATNAYLLNEQKTIIEFYTKYVKENSDNENKIIKDIDSLYSILNKFEIVSNEEKVENKENRIIIEDGDQIIFDADIFRDYKENLKSVRNKYLSTI